MAARLNPSQDAKTREKIRVTQLVRRLEMFTFGEPEPTTGEPVRMSKEQIRAAEILLKKCLPDLSSVEHTGNEGSPVYVMALPPVAGDFDAWNNQHNTPVATSHPDTAGDPSK